MEEGVVGRGPAVVVSGSGSVHVWQLQSGFDPAGMPSTSPDMTFTVSGDQIDALFDAWSSTNVKGLPHPGPGAECSAVVSVTMCAGCEEITIPSYSNAVQLDPEMESVWAWFDTNLAMSSSAMLPRSYCRF